MAIRLLVIVGPTATGKTRLGVEVAHALATEIISADSRQVYRGLDLGSGKDLDEYSAVSPAVPYHLIDVADPREVYSVFHYQRDCYALLETKAREERYRDGAPLVMVGGSGLLVEAVLRGYRIPNVPEDPSLREELMLWSHAELLEELRRLDANLFEKTDQSSKKRVVRAIEIARHGKAHEIEYGPPPPVEIEHAVFAVDLPTEELHRRIETRLHARLEEGLVEEVRGLLDAGVTRERMDQLGLEYREVTAHLTGEKSRDRMIDDLSREIRRLAKRQRTWFRGFPRRGIDVRPLHGDDARALLEHEWGD